MVEEDEEAATASAWAWACACCACWEWRARRAANWRRAREGGRLSGGGAGGGSVGGEVLLVLKAERAEREDGRLEVVVVNCVGEMGG